MRTPEYLSPTSISLWESDREEFYVKYLANHRPPRMPQTLPMSVGSAFDAFVKNCLVVHVYGGLQNHPEFELDAIFEEQVEPQNRTFAKVAGQRVFDQYRYSGALSDLMLDIDKAVENPRFEFTLLTKFEGVPLMGKPDCSYVVETPSKTKQTIIRDFKVNGYCGQRRLSPKKGYLRVRDGWRPTDANPENRNNHGQHKDACPMVVGGVLLNISHFIEDIDPTWARQLVIYAWQMGAVVGGPFFVGIEQAFRHGGDADGPLMRFASSMCRSSTVFQTTLLAQIKQMWGQIQSGWIFDNLSREENDIRCNILDEQGKAFESDSDVAALLKISTRSQPF